MRAFSRIRRGRQDLADKETLDLAQQFEDEHAARRMLFLSTHMSSNDGVMECDTARSTGDADSVAHDNTHSPPLTPYSTKRREADIALAVSRALQSGTETTPRGCSRLHVPWEKGTPTCFTVPYLLSETECMALIQLSEAQGYKQAQVNVGGGRQVTMTDVRRSCRCIIDSHDAVATLWQRLQQFMPREIVPGIDRSWRPIGLNERLRFLRYDPGDYFRPHHDGTFIHPDNGSRSFQTMMIYLNEPERGGETNFVNPRDEGEAVSVRPTTGLALVFDHEMYHEGAQLLQGYKYAIRTDVMYERCAVECRQLKSKPKGR
mmetsp:Transcript_46320/g.76645  ORF Transcript_46320/g.76645 Transcript_46320/m.76645 type:complete len:318 (-) Transcript_46320:335-1288(-)